MRRLALLALALGAACTTPLPEPASEGTLFSGGTIYLGHPDWRSTDALFVRRGRVVAVGQEARALASEAGEWVTTSLAST